MIRPPLDDPAILKKFNYYARLNKLLTHMKMTLTGRLQLEDAARVACMEKTAFSKFFTRTVGITFHDFVQQWRVAVAVEQMRTSDKSLTEIGLATGFQSMVTFERAFKRLTGLTPSEFRRNLLCREEIRTDQELIYKTHGTMTHGQEMTSSLSGGVVNIRPEVTHGFTAEFLAQESDR